ncbi:hypothetical protein E4U43_008576 [Claviceps pusilla]|uniref:ubiquitinyl hydrolase 1 n=1 Tax=Claviceps pusilla TaxID=123648 RepID=A0A9P7NAX7_9HYPO|nr:hypothetical protein E4U43_008576 [Claviceps pusilla]
MTSRHPQFANFYDDQVAAFRQVQSRQRILDRVNEPAVIITVAILLVAIILKAYDIEVSFDAVTYAALTYLWDLIVLLTPTSLIVAVDHWLNPSSISELPPSTHAAKSEIMQRIVGLNRTGGMMESVFQVRSRALSVTNGVLGFKGDPERPAGLGNRDNSCYQNSILQGLASLTSFHRYLSACVQTIDTQQQANDVAHTLRTLITELNDVSNNGKTIWTPPLLKSMSTWTQQDAQEYFSKVLDDIDKSVDRAVKAMRRHSGLKSDSTKDDVSTSEHSEDSGYQSASTSTDLLFNKSLRNPLEGLLAQRVACIQCGYSEGLSMIPFNCLTLSLGLDKHQHDLYERLDAYSKVEAIEGVECPKCTLLKAQKLLTKLVEMLKESNGSNDSRAEQMKEPMRRLEAVGLALEEDHFDDKTMTEECKISSQSKVTTTKTKQIVIARPPQSLAIHVNRSVFDPRTFDMIKNSAPLSFPQTLDLGPWCLGSAEDIKERLSGETGPGEEQWQLDPKSSMIAGDLNPSRLSGPIYELRAAVTHYGRHENGHYICYRRYPESVPFDEDQKSSASVADAIIDYDGENVGQGERSEQGEGELEQELEQELELEQEEKEKEEEKKEEGDSARDPKTEVQHPPLRSNRGWWRLSDHNVSEVEEDVISSLGPGVFMLFYECVDPVVALQPEPGNTEDVGEDSSLASSESEATMDHDEPSNYFDGPCRFGQPASRTTVDVVATEDAYSSSSASDVSEPETLPTTTDTIEAPTIVTSAPSSVSNWTQDQDDTAKGYDGAPQA